MQISAKDDRFVDWKLSRKGETPNPPDLSVQINSASRLDGDLESIARFPDENPYPVLRLGFDGVIQYGNKPSTELLREWGVSVKGIVPGTIQREIEAITKSGKTIEIQIEVEEKIFSLILVPIKVWGYINVYGRDVTQRVQAERNLILSEERYRRIVNTSEEGIWLVDGQNRTTFVNPKLSSMLGYSPEEMLGKTIYEFMDEEMAALAQESMARRARGVNETLDFRYIRKDGSQIWTIIAVSPILDDAGQYIGALAMVTDITGRKKAEEELRESKEKNLSLYLAAEKRLAETVALRTIDRAISNSLDIRFTLDVVLTQTLRELKVDAADILIYNPTTHILNFFIGQGFRTAATQGAHIPLGKGYAGQAILDRKAIHINNLSSLETEFQGSPLFPLEEFEQYHCVPLLAKGKVLGVLEVFERKAPEHPAQWLDYLETLAWQTAIAIDSITLFEDLQRANDNLTLGYDATIEGWSRALDLRDHETEGHTQRVTTLTLQLARQMGIEDEELVHIRRGALLHDIGKMGVPDTILLKPGKLTDDEWVLMRKHPQLAYEMLTPILYLKDALDIPHFHHEKWDGSGYPQGLKGEQIPLAARIFAVVDVYDALTSDRHYRKAWTKEKALEHIRAETGKHFDPNVVEAFLRVDLK
jgi:PAS domain S-box-containing protein/putative nucleotidyltransferase with HDIG domain